ncbi:MAG: hypothetical protein HY703_05990 [Gemmatimonadetes bacterium]|nr:hypothetical protein [Gemmatimonadota bacterium]
MSSVVFDDQVLDRLRERHPRFHDTAYLFVLSSLHYVLERLPAPRHISGRELAEGARDLALDRFGPMAASVFEYWGIESTADVGQIVFALVDCGILIKQEEDAPEDFAGLFDFREAFERKYPWGASP